MATSFLPCEEECGGSPWEAERRTLSPLKFMNVCGFARRTGTPLMRPFPMAALHCMLPRLIPSAAARASTISKPTCQERPRQSAVKEPKGQVVLPPVPASLGSTEKTLACKPPVVSL